MGAFRRVLGILVMAAGVLGFILSVSGLIAIWAVRPQLTQSLQSTIDTVSASITTSKNVLSITKDALGATVTSVDSLSSMLDTTAVTVEDTQPVFTKINDVLGDVLPASLKGVSSSLVAAQNAAITLEASLASLENFQSVVSAIPTFGSLVVKPAEPQKPVEPLSESLGKLAKNLEDLPQTFLDMSGDMDSADDNLVLLQTNLTTMSVSVATISTNLSEYEAVVGESQQSMDNLQTIVNQLQSNMPMAMRLIMAGLTVFLLWLVAAQVVIWSQGLELYRGSTRDFEPAHHSGKKDDLKGPQTDNNVQTPN